MSKEQEKEKLAERKKLKIPKPADLVNYIYLAAIFSFYLLWVDNGYFNITFTRYMTFMVLTSGFVVLAMICLAVRLWREGEEDIPVAPAQGVERWKKPGLWMLAFLLSNMFAYAVCTQKEDALYGRSGRYMGLLIYLAFGLMFFLLGMGIDIKKELFYVFAAGSAVAMCVAISQHMQSKVFPFSGFGSYLKEGISDSQYTQFVSTFGNINIFAGFLCIAIPVFIGMFVFFDTWHAKLVAAVLLVLGGYAIFVANSDSTYFGIALASVCIFLLALWHKKTLEFFLAYVLLAFGNLWVELMNTYGKHVRYDKKRGGFALAIDRLDYAEIFLLVTAGLAMAALYLRRVLANRETDRKKVLKCVIAGMAALAVIAVVWLVAIKKAVSFPLDYKWGSFRGYIWTKICELYRDAPLVNKLFGYGQESVRMLVEGAYYQEMLEVTGRTYDNAHNELLQYLLTTGACGLVSYLGLFICSVRYMLVHAKGDAKVYVCLFAVIGYFAQSIISLNQPITTPLFFVFLATGIGLINHNNKKETGGNKNETI